MTAEPPREVRRLVDERAARRAERDWAGADALRDRLRELGWDVVDSPSGSTLRPSLPDAPAATGYARSEDLASVLGEAATFALSVQLLAEADPDDLRRFLHALGAHLPARSLETVVVANAPTFDLEALLSEVEPELPVATLPTSARLGWADARNLGLRRSRGAVTVLCDASIEPLGDFLTPLADAFDDPGVGLAGPWGLRSDNGRQFREGPGGEVDAVQAYCLAVRREVLRDAGLFDRHFHFYRNADLDFSFQARATGWRALQVNGLPLRRHEPHAYAALPAEERDRLSRRNFYRYLRRWGDRRDLLLAASSPDDDGHD